MQENESDSQRGSEFSFSFLLTEELKEWVTGSNGGKLFLENVNDGIQKEIKKIMETWCVTPMVPSMQIRIMEYQLFRSRPGTMN